MALSGRGEPEQVDGAARVRAIVQSTRIAQMIYAMVELGIPDSIGNGSRSEADLILSTQAHGPTLHRLLRALIANDFLTQQPDGTYQLTESGTALRADVPGSARALVQIQLHDARWRQWGGLVTSVRTGRSATRELFGMSDWEYLAHHPDVAERFNAFMSSNSMVQQDAVLHAYDFSIFRTVVDIGGGHGQLLGSILRAYPALHGILFDQPAVVAGAGPLLGELGVADRCTIVGGSFFEDVPTVGDAYLLKLILHDWEDEPASKILSTIHRAMRPGDRILVVDTVLPEDRPLSVAEAFFDLNMLVLLDGKERTKSEFGALFESTGFRLERVVPTSSTVSIVEGVCL